MDKIPDKKSTKRMVDPRFIIALVIVIAGLGGWLAYLLWGDKLFCVHENGFNHCVYEQCIEKLKEDLKGRPYASDSIPCLQ
jgi:hypothetical protein